jgi:ornithine carbamoyltransferase
VPQQSIRGAVMHLNSITDLGNEELHTLIVRGQAFAADESRYQQLSSGRLVGLFFRAPSTRTRTAFTRALHRMGAGMIHYAAGDLQLSNGESIGDTAMALSCYLDALVVRTNGPPEELRALAAASEGMPIINALCKSEHPTQAIADLITLRQHFGELAGVHLLYVGAACNTMHSLMLAAAKTRGMKLTIITPQRFAPDPGLVVLARASAAECGAELVIHHDIERGASGVHAVYTTRWESMGEEPALVGWRDDFRGFRVDAGLLARVGDQDTIFLHDLPATRGSEVTDALLDGPNSHIRRQSFNKSISAAVVLAHLLCK